MGTDTAAIASRLHEARANAQAVAIDPAAIVSLTDAYEVQSELIGLARDRVAGWKVAALTEADQARYGADRPIAGVLFPGHVHAAPVALALSSFIVPMIECEIAFLLGADLPYRAQPYGRAQIEAAVAAVVPVFEFTDSRLAEPASDLLRLADVMNNGALVTGAPLRDWQDLGLGAIDIALTRDGEGIERGSSARILGDPLLALLALANAQPLPYGLLAGQIVTTGSCTTPFPVAAGRYVATFAGLGEVEVRMTP